MKLIFEDYDSKIDSIISESEGKKDYYIRGVFSTIDTKNRNGRIYPRKLWEENVEKYQEVIKNKTNSALMEWEHPPRTKVDPMEAVGIITKLEIDGDYVIGEAKLLDNPKANQLKTLIDNGVDISVSSRGVGKVGNGGIVESFTLVTYDFVASPSDLHATMKGLREEYLEEGYIVEDGILQNEEYEITETGEIVCSIDNPEACGCELSETVSKDYMKQMIKEATKGFLGSLESVNEKTYWKAYKSDLERVLSELSGIVKEKCSEKEWIEVHNLQSKLLKKLREIESKTLDIHE